jgi:hypothetical protein
MEMSESEIAHVKKEMQAIRQEIVDAIQMIDNVCVNLESEKNWNYSTDLAKAKQKLLDLIS